ncbi:hypothetical protein I2I05_09055 [Hymenobacter sp. BT683]|uniref:Uncharacterized protein n=1 Tax=Hymenobacter jeongseonensis TaxID=2791027 RepID=A0ABS0IGQ8_9BACT|nr:hypothetical protein [Hymenobacter jeongseonensis]MBF9237542.1 hypothetical protein [Hymenobacter jeongseonensis]
MQALQAYLRLRRHLVIRQLREVGWVRLALLLPVLLVAVGRALVMAASSPVVQWAVPVGVAALLAAAHRQRADLRFLAISAPAFRRWLAVEYLLWALPVALMLLAFKDWGAAGLTLLLTPLAAAVPAMREARSTRMRSRSFFRSEAFEWVSGMRGAGWVWLPLLAGAVWQHTAPLAPIAALACWLLVLLACYGVPEPLTMLVLAARTARRFLLRRLLLGLGFGLLTAAPFLGVLATGPAGVAGAVAVGVVWLGLLGLVILAKYAFYPNAMQLRITQALVVGIAVALPGNPVYPALLLAAVGGLIWQSQRRLRAVLGPDGR